MRIDTAVIVVTVQEDRKQHSHLVTDSKHSLNFGLTDAKVLLYQVSVWNTRPYTLNSPVCSLLDVSPGTSAAVVVVVAVVSLP